MFWLRLTLSAALAAAVTAAPAQETAVELDPVTIAANRFEPLNTQLSPHSALTDEATTGALPSRDLSELLSQHPSFSAYRRSTSVAAHPTTQGARMRNLGANATSRTLVLLDGTPLNDPFGGWIHWHQINLAQIESVNVSASGGGESWGNFGAGGVISAISATPPTPAAQARFAVGDAGDVQLDSATTQALSEELALDLGLRLLRTDGYHTLRADQRGPLDETASSSTEVVNARLRWRPDPQWNAQVAVRGFRERRGNGTPLARNDTEGLNVSALAQRLLANDARVSLAIYRQDQTFRNVFTSVSEDRSSETPALDQFRVPASAVGASLAYRRDFSDRAFLQFGADFREVEGSVNERFRNMGDGFTRERYAGGEQRFAGVFGTVAHALTDKDSVSATLRRDAVRTANGARRERDLENGGFTLDDTYPDLKRDPSSWSLRWRHDFSDAATSYASVFHGFRAPTLNELYRPYRVRNDITEANPSLLDEEQTGAELAFEIRPASAATLRLAAFAYRLDNMIANVLVTTSPGFDPRFGFIPAGGSGTLRANLDESQVSGFELRATWALAEPVTLDFHLMRAESEVRSDSTYPGLIGEPFPQASEWRANAVLLWKISDKWSLGGRGYWSSSAYEELGDPNELPSYALADIELNYDLSPGATLGVSVENVFDEEVVTGVAGNGLISIGAPRSFRLGLSWRR